MAHLLYIDPVLGDEVYCKCDEYKYKANHWQSVAKLMAILMLEDNEYAKKYARDILDAVSKQSSITNQGD